MEYFCNAEKLAVTEQPLYEYLLNSNSATHKYMRDLMQVFGRFMERKEALAARYGLDADDRFAPEALAVMWQLLDSTGADTAGCAHWNLTPAGERTPELLLPQGIYDRQGIRKRIVYPLLGDRLTQPVFNGYIWRYLFSAQIIRQAEITFEGAYLEDELF